jgi:hypothetical protein
MVSRYIRAGNPWKASREVEELGLSFVGEIEEVGTRQEVMRIAGSQ